MATSNPVYAAASSVWTVVVQMWRDVKSVYYANTPIWRWLKSGTLVFLGLALWSGANVLLSNRPDWGWLTYVMAYGFILVAWGPLTHFLLVPLAIRLRRTAEHPLTRAVARHASKLNLTVFFTIVLVVATFAPGIMLLDFSGALGGGDGAPDASATVECDRPTDGTVACSVGTTGPVDHVVVTSGSRELAVVEDGPPYEFEVPVDDLADATTGKEFVVELRDGDGATLRRYVQTVFE